MDRKGWKLERHRDHVQVIAAGVSFCEASGIAAICNQQEELVLISPEGKAQLYVDPEKEFWSVCESAIPPAMGFTELLSQCSLPRAEQLIKSLPNEQKTRLYLRTPCGTHIKVSI